MATYEYYLELKGTSPSTSLSTPTSTGNTILGERGRRPRSGQ